MLNDVTGAYPDSSAGAKDENEEPRCKPNMRTLSTLKDAAQEELVSHILPYWMARSIDDEHGGFVGRIDGRNEYVPEAPKGLVLNARILWTFSAAWNWRQDDAYLALANRAYDYLMRNFWDRDQGGGHWLLDHTGVPINTRKRVYGQVFFLYALSEYYLATGEEEVRDTIEQFFGLLEQNTRDTQFGGYFEAYDRSWTQVNEGWYSELGGPDVKTSNTMLHVLEAYTRVYAAWPIEAVRAALAAILTLFLDRIIDSERAQMHLAFRRDWTPVTQTISFGHDIEASWLLVEAAEALGDEALLERTRAIALRMVDVVVRNGIMEDGSMIYEVGPRGVDTDRHWWPQAEGVVGLVNAYQLSGNARYVEAAEKMWAYIDRHLIDRDHGGWFFQVDAEGNPNFSNNKIGPWKGPYHNGRACMEVMRRVDLIEE